MGKILDGIRTALEKLQNTSPIFRNGISDTPVRTWVQEWSRAHESADSGKVSDFGGVL